MRKVIETVEMKQQPIDQQMLEKLQNSPYYNMWRSLRDVEWSAAFIVNRTLLTTAHRNACKVICAQIIAERRAKKKL